MRRKFSIVMADDDLDDQYLVKRAFEKSHVLVTVHPVYDGIQLLDFLYRRYQFKHITDFPDLILLDLNMPLMDGFEALRRIKSDPGTAHIPVYVVTTSRTEDDKKRAIELGAAGFYTKGASSKEIERIVKEVCLECFQ
jgi:CheY-like chemotaxis protein